MLNIFSIMEIRGLNGRIADTQTRLYHDESVLAKRLCYDEGAMANQGLLRTAPPC